MFFVLLEYFCFVCLFVVLGLVGLGIFSFFCVLGGVLGVFCRFVCWFGFIGFFPLPLFPCLILYCSRRSSERELSKLFGFFQLKQCVSAFVSFMVMMKDCSRRGRCWKGVERTIKFREVFPVQTPQQKICPLVLMCFSMSV